MASTATSRVLAAVQDERWRQEAKWGEQHHPDVIGPGEAVTAAYKGMADAYRVINDGATQVPGATNWANILLEEVYEALAEAGADPATLRAELVQVAAVAVAWIEDIDSRGAHGVTTA